MIRRLLVVLVASLVGVWTGVSPAGAVVGGSWIPIGSNGFVVRVSVSSARVCSGALVTPEWVVTAASCFAVDGQPVSTGTPALPTTVTVGRFAPSVVRIVPHASRNIVLAKLSLRVADVEPLRVSRTAPAVGEAVWAAGYGRTETKWVPDRPYMAATNVASVGTDSFGWAGQEAGACRGDAGGPVLRHTDGHFELAGVDTAAGQGGCLGEADSPLGATAVRTDDLGGWIAANTPSLTTSFGTSFHSSDGIAGYDLLDGRDRAVPFDYDHSGKLDHLLFYRPGTGTVWIVKHNADDTYQAVFHSSSGIGDYELADARDRIVTFDYDHSGKVDDLLLYRPGAGIVSIVKHYSGSTFRSVYYSNGGIGGYDLAEARDRIVAFDYDHTGKLDYLVLYRPGAGIVHVVKHDPGAGFRSVFQSLSGIGGYDLRSPADRIVAFDYGHSWRLDHLVLYRPGTGTVWVLQHGAGAGFSAVFHSSSGIGGYNLADARDRIVAFDYERSGKLDHLVLYRPGARTVWVLQHGAGAGFSAVFHSSSGIGGYNLADARDRIVAFDDAHSGGQNHLLLYRPGVQTAWVVGRQEPAAPAPVSVRPPDRADSIVEDFSYPGAAEILDTLNVRLISGDGHILLADCATEPVDNIGVIKVWTTEQAGEDGWGQVCFTVTGPVGRLDLDVPGVYEIRGDGQEPGYGHDLTAVVDTETGAPVTVVVNPSGSTQVGIGADPDNEPTTLLQLRVPA